MKIFLGILAVVTLINFFRNPRLLMVYLGYGLLGHIAIGLVFFFFGVDTTNVSSQGSEFEIWLFGGGMVVYGGAIFFYNFVMIVIGTGEALEERELQKEYAAQDALWKNEFRPGVEAGKNEKERTTTEMALRRRVERASLPVNGEIILKKEPPVKTGKTGQTLADMLRPLRFVRTDCNCDKCGRYDWCSHIFYEDGDIFRCDWCEDKMVKHSMHKSAAS